MAFQNQKLKVLIVFGTRPDAIKMAPVIKEFSKDPAFDVLLCDTGQHDSTVTNAIMNFFDVHGKTARLETMIPGQTLNHIVQNVIVGIDNILEMFVPDIMLVQGDTTSAMAATIAGFNRRTFFGHIEAGMRTGNIENPYPEEFNRCIIDKAASILFAPTQFDSENLGKEGIDKNYIFTVGNTSIDSLIYCKDKIPKYMPRSDNFSEYVLVTIHRRESFGNGIKNIIKSINEIAKLNEDIGFIWPVHPNPNINPFVYELINVKNIIACEPFDYMRSIHMIQNATAIITDSGGVQEEATTFAIPTIIARDKTDRMGHKNIGEIKQSAADYVRIFKDNFILAGTSTDKIINAFEKISKNFQKRRKLLSMSKRPPRIYPVYGDGLASKRIVAIIKQKFGIEPCYFPDPPSFSYANWK